MKFLGLIDRYQTKLLCLYYLKKCLFLCGQSLIFLSNIKIIIEDLKKCLKNPIYLFCKLIKIINLNNNLLKK